MADQYLQVPPNSTGLKMDLTELTVGSNTVERERVNIAGSAAAALAEVLNADPTTQYGLVVRNIPSGTQPISGSISFTAPQHVIVDSGAITVSGTIAFSNTTIAVTNTGTFAVQASIARVAQTPASPTAATVGVTSAAAVGSDSSRTGLVLINTSTAWISLGLGAAAVLYSGITLAPNGGTWEMDTNTFTTVAINAIASAATSNLAIQVFD